MPLYDFACSDCGHSAELRLSLSQRDSQQVCPKCQSNGFLRQVSKPQFRLKGSGWYETDDKPKNKQKNVVRTDGAASTTSD